MGIAFTKGDYLTLKGWSNVTAGLVALIDIRPKDWGPPAHDLGDPYSLSIEVDLADDRTQGTTHVKMETSGEIDDAVINYTSSTSLARGQTYAQLLLQRTGTTRAAVSLLAAGYVYGGFTNGGHLPSLHHITEAGPGNGEGVSTQDGTDDPAANAEPSTLTVPAGAKRRPLSFRIAIVQGITDTPRPSLLIRDASDTVIARSIVPADVPVSSTVNLCWTRGVDSQQNVPAATANGTLVAPMPDIIMEAGWDMILSTEGLGANSNYGVGVVEFEEWVVPT